MFLPELSNPRIYALDVFNHRPVLLLLLFRRGPFLFLGLGSQLLFLLVGVDTGKGTGPQVEAFQAASRARLCKG